MHEAYIQTISSLPGFSQTADLSRAHNKVAARVAASSGLDEFETEELLQLPLRERNDFYWKVLDAHQMFNAKRAVRAATIYLGEKALFLGKDVHDRLTAFIDQAWKALSQTGSSMTRWAKLAVMQD